MSVHWGSTFCISNYSDPINATLKKIKIMASGLITSWQIDMLKSEKAMALHSSALAWKIPWTEEPGRLQSMESQRVGHD